MAGCSVPAYIRSLRVDIGGNVHRARKTFAQVHAHRTMQVLKRCPPGRARPELSFSRDLRPLLLMQCFAHRVAARLEREKTYAAEVLSKHSSETLAKMATMRHNDAWRR